MKDRKKIIEISRWKVEDADGFQAMDPIETGEEPDTAECDNIEEDVHDGAHNQNKTDKGKATTKSKSPLR
jgi:hypothetical protein